MKIGWMLLMASVAAVGQAPQAKTPDIIAGTGITIAPISPPQAIWLEELKDGVYTATLRDPNNKWRCYVGGVAEGMANGITRFTIICVDTTTSTVPPPAASLKQEPR